jgi:uncharacterized protein (TIGR03435 family)
VTHIRRITLPALVVLSFPASARSQSPARPEFEVASIKPNTSENGRSSTRPGPTELYLENTSLRKCIAIAYNVSEDRDSAISAPDWLNFERYDIAAKFPAGTPLQEVRVMLQNLLADRFRLKLHRESKEVPIYALVAAKNGPKLNESAPGIQGSIGMSNGHLSGKGVPLSALVDRLSGSVFQLGRPVVDRTGISGLYDFTLDWASDDSAPSLFTALQEQLGLRLEAQKGTVEVLVVDSMERKPSAN